MRPRLLLAACLPFLLPAAYPADEPKRAEPVNLACNTDADEVDPFLASDGKTLYYSAKGKDDKRFRFMASRRATPAAAWGKGEPLDDAEPNLASKSDDRGVTLTPEGVYKQYIIFASKKDDAKEASFDLYVGVKDGRDRVFTAIAPVKNVSDKDDEMHPCLSHDGKALFFSKKTADGWRLFVARRAQAAGTQGFDDVKMVKEFPANFHAATLLQNGTALMMILQGPLESGKTGLFLSKLQAGTWTKPEPLELLNHPDATTGDFLPSLSRDGSRLYFVSDRPGGKGGLDLWTVPVAQILK